MYISNPIFFMKTLVLALGNPLRGDDGIGSAVLDYSEETAVFPPHITLIDGGTPGLETALTLQGHDRVIVIDAADMGTQPGTWMRFHLSDVSLAKHAHMNGTLHDAGFAEAVALAGALGILPPEIIMYGIQPESMDWDSNLSQSIQKTIPAICQQIKTELSLIAK